MLKKIKGFTLIELLIVVAIIAILAAIAVPNFLEAQVRSKVSRARADMRTLATGLESYNVDSNHYPGSQLVTEGTFQHQVMRIWQLTTPIAYVSSGGIFKDPLKKGTTYLDQRSFLYEYISKDYYIEVGNTAGGDWFSRTYGNWRIVCAGPDGWVFNSGLKGPDGQPAFWTITYDPSNGTISCGDIMRTSNKPEFQKEY